MIQLMEGLNIDTPLLSFASFIYGLALIAIYKMPTSRKDFYSFCTFPPQHF